MWAARATSGWPWLGARRPEVAAPRSRSGGGGGGPVARGGGERVGEHQRRSRELATGSVWRGKGWRGELHGELGSGGADGGGGGRSRQQGFAGRGARAQKGRRGG